MCEHSPEELDIGSGSLDHSDEKTLVVVELFAILTDNSGRQLIRICN